MARVKCITMQRDEWELLPAWLRYHGALFGLDNLVVFDNGSTDRRVVELLEGAQAAGVDVRWTHREARDLASRGAHLRNLMRGWEEANLVYDFALPLDCDEFLVRWTRAGLDGRAAAIGAEMDRLRGEDRALRIRDVLFNVPGRPGWFVLGEQPKCFLPAHAAGEIDGSLRHATSSRAAGECATALATLHFRNKTLRALRARTRRRVEAGGDVPADRAAVLALDEGAYLRRYDDRILLGFPQFGATLAALGIRSDLLGAPPPAGRRVPAEQVAFLHPAVDAVPFWFDGAGYLERHPDVAGADWPAALHYARHGGLEGRQAPGETLG